MITIENKILLEPCPNCKGRVMQTYFSSDCRGNPTSTHIECVKCHKAYSVEDWVNVEINFKAEKNAQPKKKIEAPHRPIVCKCGSIKWFVEHWRGVTITLKCAECGEFGCELRTRTAGNGRAVINFKVKA